MAMEYTLDFERPVQELENQIKELEQKASQTSTATKLDFSSEIKALKRKLSELAKEVYSKLTPWERVQLSRHPSRPHSIDYIEKIITNFYELHGDRKFSDDSSMLTGLGELGGHKVGIVAIEKGRTTKEKIHRNFGMCNPEGYRKAMRLMKLCSDFHIPIVTFVDTPGAYPGIGAEERGQAQAIAENLADMFDIKTPILSVIIGEGGSGGALGVAVSDRVFMMEFSVYSVISPESCASILWSDPKKAEVAANSLQLSPTKALELGVIDSIIDEPLGGAHRNPDDAMQNVKKLLSEELTKLKKISTETLIDLRLRKFRSMGNKTLIADEGGETSQRLAEIEKYGLEKTH